MPPATVSAAARLAAMTNPIGGAKRQAPVTPSTSAASGFPGLLADQMGLSGAGGTAGTPGMPASGGSALDSLLGGGKSPMSSALASPQLARALAAAKNTAGTVAGAVSNGAAAPGTASAKAQKALAWAKSKLGQQDWNNLCEKFVEEAYGSGGIYPTAKDAAHQAVKHKGMSSLTTAPPGALLYFAADDTNDHAGHAAIYLGNGEMISARPTGVQVERVDSQYNRERFLGWGDAPASFAPRRLGPAPRTAPTTRTLPLGAAGAAQLGATGATAATQRPPAASRSVASLTPTLPVLAGLNRASAGLNRAGR